MRCLAVTGRDADGNVETDSITISSGDATATGTVSFAGRYLITVTPPAALNPTTLTWGASVTTVSNSVTNGMIPILFPVSNLDMNENANIEDSDLISAIGSATPPDIGQYSGQMNFTTGLLTEELPYLLDGIFNNPTSSTAVVPQDADGGTAINPPVAAAVGLTQVDTNHPSKLKIAFAAAPGAAGTFTITGYTKIGSKQNNRRYRTETITVNTTDQNYESRYYYVWDANNPLTVTSAFATQPGNARFTLDPELYEIEFTIARNDVQFPGWSVQGLVGGEPRTGFTVVPSVMNINATPTGVSFEMQCPAGQITRKRTIQGGDVEEPFLDADYTNAASTRFGGWSGSFSYAGEIVKMTNLAIGFNRSYSPDEAVDGDRFATDIEASDDRAVTVSPTTRFQSSYQKSASVNNWQDIFRDETRTALEAQWNHYSGFGQRRRVLFSFPSCLIIESPQSTASGGANIDEALSMQAFATNTQREFSVTLFTTKSYSV